MAKIRLPAGGWAPRKYQMNSWGAWEQGCKRLLLCWHRRAGKDEVSLHIAAIAAHLRPANYWHCLPEFSSARRAIWEAVNPHTGKKRIDEAFPKELRKTTREDTMTIEFMMFFIKGASLFIGSDSGPAQIAVGFDIPSVIFFGSVNSHLRYSNFNKIMIVQSECPKKETKHCYHSTVDVVGVDCVHNKELPPCTNYSSEQVLNAVKEFI